MFIPIDNSESFPIYISDQNPMLFSFNGNVFFKVSNIHILYVSFFKMFFCFIWCQYRIISRRICLLTFCTKIIFLTCIKWRWAILSRYRKSYNETASRFLCRSESLRAVLSCFCVQTWNHTAKKSIQLYAFHTVSIFTDLMVNSYDIQVKS